MGPDDHASGITCSPTAVDQPGAKQQTPAWPLFLSPRQREVLAAAAQGQTGRETATRLGISRATVRGHLVSARARLHARSTCHAVALAIKGGLI